MAELNLKQIIDRLNAEFTGETRKLVFWYDDKAEFAEDMETVELQNAKIYYLQPDNQFYTKYFLERVDKTTNYLIYAPFPKPDVRDNHLEDTMLYSRRFFADRASLLSVDLGIEEKYKPVIEKHIKFFANKERTQRFYDLEIENFNEENILVGLLSAVCKARTCSFEEVVRIVLTDGELVDNAFLQEFEKYDLEFKMERGHMETKNAEIALVSIVHKITNLITSMDFIQSDAVSDTVKAAKYRIFFLSEDNEKISNENSYVADSREENAQKRIFRMRFTFKNKKYDKDKQYYLVVYDEESGLEQWRQPVIMDIAFADDFGFGF